MAIKDEPEDGTKSADKEREDEALEGFKHVRLRGRGSLVGCHLWGRTESDTTEVI